MSIPSPKKLRQKLITARKNLPVTQVQKSAKLLLHHLKNLDCYRDAKSIAIYLAVNGEADPIEIKLNAWAAGKTVYLPVITEGSLFFAPFNPDSHLVSGRYNIPVPKHSGSDIIRPESLDIVVTPLVAFDKNLNRVGMGGGFYDRTFSFRQNNVDKPTLIGIAHDLQRVSCSEPQHWDVPMDLVITEKTIYYKSISA